MTVSAQVIVRNGRAAIAFYERAFGAQVIYQVGGTDALPDVVAELQVGGTTFWVSDEAPSVGNFSPETLGGTTAKLLLRTADPAAVHARALALGAVDAGPVKAAHGWLIGRVVDPFGHVWEIGTPLGAWPPAPRTAS